MSVKGKVKRCNAKILKLEQENAKLKTELHFTRAIQNSTEKELYRNIIKYLVTNHVGNLRAGMMICRYEVDKMNGLRLDIGEDYFEHAYMIRITY